VELGLSVRIVCVRAVSRWGWLAVKQHADSVIKGVTMAISEKELAAIRERCERATSGPWTYIPGRKDCDGPDNNRGCVKKYTDNECEQCLDYKYMEPASVSEIFTIDGPDYDGINDVDAEFIALARTDIPRLLDEVEQLRGLLGEAYGELVADSHRDGPGCLLLTRIEKVLK